MKTVIRIAGLMLALITAFAAVRLFAQLPADNKENIAQKYAGWSGVLQAGVCSRWQASGSFTRWLNRCAADFEKQHDGVYIEFIECEETDIPGIFEIYTPDMFFFSPGVITDESAAADVQAVCIGGYALAYNRNMDITNPLRYIQTDTDAHCYTAASVALCGAGPDSESSLPDAAMDIGLPASAAETDMFNRFTAGEIPCIAVSSKDISRLQKLSDAGKGPDWALICPDGIAFTDQILYMMTPSVLPDDGRAEIIAGFARFLLTDECQSYLSDIGAIPVCGGNIYPAHSPYAAVEAWLSGEKIVPPVFSEYSAADCEAIVRAFEEGATDKRRALESIMEKRRVKGR